MSWALGIVSWIMSKLFAKPQGPSQEAVATKAQGTAETQAKAATADAAAQGAIAQAEAEAPRSQSEVVSALRSGKF